MHGQGFELHRSLQGGVDRAKTARREGRKANRIRVSSTKGLEVWRERPIWQADDLADRRMRTIDVMSAWIMSGAGLLVGSLMLTLARCDDGLARRALSLTSIGFAVLGGALTSLAVFPNEVPKHVPALFAVASLCGTSMIVIGIGALAGRDHGWPAALGMSVVGAAGLVSAHAHSERALGLALAGLLVVQAVVLGALVRRFIQQPQSATERVLGIALGTYVLVAIGRWVLTVSHEGPLGPHLLHIPEAWQGPFMIVYAGLPVLLAALIFSLLNERLRDQLREQANVDLLTGALTRRALAAQADALIARVHAKNGVVGVVMLDLDHFKRINDEHGHAAGDAVLRQAARTVASHLPGDALFARWGGEEFVVLVGLPGLPGLPEGRRLAESIRQTIADSPWADLLGVPCTVTASLGIAMLHRGETLERALARADSALYRAKKEGRDRVTAALATA
jgi:diguanylate cyclase (GGDEF)-like protein